MRILIIPDPTELKIKIGTNGNVPEGRFIAFMPQLYAPWPYAQKTGSITLDIHGETVKDLLIELSNFYRDANVDFSPLKEYDNAIDGDYDVSVNNKDFSLLSKGINSRLTEGDQVVIKMMSQWG